MKLYREGEHIVDIESCTVYSKGSSVTFNFEEMYLYNNRATSTPKPIKYDGKDIKCWVSKQWKGWKDKSTQKAINSLFNSYNDNQLLK